MYGSVMVLNASFEPIQLVGWTHAIRMLVREVAVIHEAEGDRMIGDMPFPKVLRLVKYVAMKWRGVRDPSWSRRRLMHRDRNKCGYCGKAATTVDHILPVSRGGKSSWLNTVASCTHCNSKKGSKTLAESRLVLITKVYAPSWWDLNIVPGA